MGWSVRCGGRGQIGLLDLTRFLKNCFFVFEVGFFPLFPISCFRFNLFSKNLEWSARCGACGQIGFVNWFPLFEIPPSGFNPFSKNLEWVGPQDVVRAVKLAL